jgi:Protein of unknown function (DUF3467)
MGNLKNPEGNYANYLKIGQNAFEFLFDFGQFYRDGEEPYFHTRIITSPVYAKAFLKVLKDCVKEYERTFSVIPDGEEGIVRLEVLMDG